MIKDEDTLINIFVYYIIITRNDITHHQLELLQEVCDE